MTTVKKAKCSACTGVIMPDRTGRKTYIAHLCGRCDRVFSRVRRGEELDVDMTLWQRVVLRTDLGYYQPRYDSLLHALNEVSAQVARTGTFSEPTAGWTPPDVSGNPCAGCTGYYQMYYCCGLSHYRMVFCVLCHPVFAPTLFPPRALPRPHPWYVGFLSKALPFYYSARWERVRQARLALAPPGVPIGPLNIYGGRCFCDHDCNAGWEAHILTDWRARMVDWSMPYVSWEIWNSGN